MIRSTPLRPRPQETVSPQEPNYPSKSELLACLPADLLKIDTTKAWGSLALSLGLSVLAYGVGTQIPLQPIAAPLWLLYALVTGTVAGGCWVIAHECGHHAFHPNRRVEATVGFVLHSLLLVPYFSWQHSHAVHHANCNHLEGGETHVPPRASSAAGQSVQRLVSGVGPVAYGLFSTVSHLLLGWPLYLFFGVAGGEDHGALTSHFWHGAPFRNGRRPLFPDSTRRLMLRSNVGLVLMLLALILAASSTSLARVLAVYGLPYLVINAWLVGYTWLQHTDTSIPHFATADWTWAKGALQTVDRPYGPLLNLLHHGIGSTHVCHHVNPRIPHYNAWRGNELLRARYPELVRFDPTPIHRALWRIATRCAVVSQQHPGGGFYYQTPAAASDPAR
ncbi:fatty acid desaturase [Synechococcus sp. CS-1329]|uniref:fatty acid desaturase n=1 Tax=Synechococcus sp. CS-1329 TaxID=2847975 RepID=UPI00223C22D7|nr:fatty acid desaturase [Synechococcus sp. CS-1329]MCT0219579.1 fatty acid desaturase [Synechococcus sp. CS-1329]